MFHVAACSGNVRFAYQVVRQGPLDLVLPGFILRSIGRMRDNSHLLRRLATLPRLILLSRARQLARRSHLCFGISEDGRERQ
jgi:hypothetical protein